MEYQDKHREIALRCKAGNRQAQYELYSLYAKAMFNICLRMLNNRMDAEDVLQNSFVDVYTKINSFTHQSTIGAWIKRIVINNCINFLKKKRLIFKELQAQYDKEDEGQAEKQLLFEVAQIKNAILQLPDGYRVVFNLYAVEGYDHKEIAQILNINETTSKSQYCRAKKKLRMLLETQSTHQNN